MQVDFVIKFVLKKLRNNLPANLYYHNVFHTKNVLKSAIRLANRENVKAEKELVLLQTAAVLHDSGFLKTYQNHEEASCEIAQDILPEFQYEKAAIDEICKMIMATKLPQNPSNKLAEILCDADLDYLGRLDYTEIAQKLFQELNAYGILNSEEKWLEMQVSFLKQHNYFTQTQQRIRNEQKAKNLLGLTQ